MTDYTKLSMDFDFGFTAMSQNELDVVQKAQEEATVASETVAQLQEKVAYLDKQLKSLHASIQPFLNNLKKNPEKDYIYWPARVEKINEFQKYLDNFIKS